MIEKIHHSILGMRLRWLFLCLRCSIKRFVLIRHRLGCSRGKGLTGQASPNSQLASTSTDRSIPCQRRAKLSCKRNGIFDVAFFGDWAPVCTSKQRLLLHALSSNSKPSGSFQTTCTPIRASPSLAKRRRMASDWKWACMLTMAAWHSGCTSDTHSTTPSALTSGNTVTVQCAAEPAPCIQEARQSCHSNHARIQRIVSKNVIPATQGVD